MANVLKFTLKNAEIFNKVRNKTTMASVKDENKTHKITLSSSDTRVHHKMALKSQEPPRIKSLLLVSNPVCCHAVEVITQPCLKT